MQLSFQSAELRRELLDPIESDWRSPVAFLDMKALVADLLAASSLLEVPLGVPDLASVAIDMFELAAGNSVLLQCRIDHVNARSMPDGSPDWKWINRVKIVGWREKD
jgi:hypothetical protein